MEDIEAVRAEFVARALCGANYDRSINTGDYNAHTDTEYTGD